MSKPLRWGVASGCVWIGVAISVAYAGSSIHTTRLDAALTFAGGIVATPAIGALIVYIARRFNKLSFGRRLLVALVDLYLATYLFQLATGMGQVLAQLLRGRVVDLPGSLVVGPLIGTLLGLTYTGFVLALLPLSYLNHVLIGKVWDHVRPQPGASEDRVINTIDTCTSANQILMLERGALDRWGRGDPGGFLELYAADITYFDPVTATRIDGHQEMVTYYGPWTGKIRIARYEILNPQVVVEGNMALLTSNLVNYIRAAKAVESVG